MACLALLSACGDKGSTPTGAFESTWVSGEKTVNHAGTYGTRGTAAAANVPGSRSGAVSWIDTNGSLWLFGGWGRDSAGNYGYLNDLWKFDPTGTAWTWISGSDTIDEAGVYGSLGAASPSNVPGARTGASSWRDDSGAFWLFGGTGLDAASAVGRLNDLWKFDPAALEWTWVSGGEAYGLAGVYGTQGIADPANVPGARTEAMSWNDAAGHLWLFGGLGRGPDVNSGKLNDLWEFDPATGQWTWVSGTSALDQEGVYGTLGTPSVSNVPGARSGSVTWIDAGGRLWLFGGNGTSLTSAAGHLNDLWKYDPATLEWTWVAGGSGINAAGTYGTINTAASTNIPGARDAALSWIDSSGDLWLFGGHGYDAAGSTGYLNDLWKFDPSALQWTWEFGNNAASKPGLYGTLGTASSSNNPGGKGSAVGWMDAGGNFWIFGGDGIDSASSAGYLNDLWKITR
jgi:N-acetylneuraminic acid mutarotase